MPVLAKPQHETFALLIASGVKRKEACISAGYGEKGADRQAGRLLKNVQISARVEELSAQCSNATVKALVLNRNRTLNLLNQAIDEALSEGNYHAAIKGIELLGKELGMFVERSMDVPWDGDFQKLTDDQLPPVVEQLKKALEERRNAHRGPTSGRTT